LGHNKARTHGSGPQYLISDLGQFDFEGKNPEHRMRLTTYHQGITMKRIQAKTGFELEIAPDIQETPPPSEEELYLLRNEIDPLGIRRLELMSGSNRRALLREIIMRENSEAQSIQ
jgi:hypothetical protein